MTPDALRAEYEDHDDGGKPHEAGDVRGGESGQDSVDETEDQAADHRPRDAAQAPEYYDRNALHEGKTAHGRANAEERADEPARHRGNLPGPPGRHG